MELRHRPFSPRAAVALVRRAFLVCLACSIAAPCLAQNAEVLADLGLEVLAVGLDSPISLANAGLPGDDRLFVVLQGGRVLVWDGGAMLDRPFLDLRGRVSTDAKEQGLLSIAFHPLYADNGLFFVHYTDPAGDTVLERYRVSVGDPDVADALSGEVVLTVDQPTPTHNGGQLHFGPDGHLYMALGDGNSANDPGCNAQSPDTLLGKILRLDGSALAAPTPEALAPADNPFLGDDPRPDLAWVYGLRNPWRFSFDRATGDLWIGDVGQGRREEVDRLPAGSGGGVNFGWDVMEGSLCGAAPEGCPAGTPPCGDPSLTLPVLEYVNEGTTGGDCAVIGGYVYRGAAIPDLVGVYLLGDFCTGRIRAGVPRLGGSAEAGFDLIETPLAAPSVAGFGEDAGGELHLVTRSGSLQRLTGPGAPGACVPGPATLCLAGGRFRVEAGFRPADAVLQGRAVRVTPDTGYFWVFDEANVEVVVKVIDACEPFDRFWVFAGGLTDVGVELSVTDAEREATVTYENPRGTPFQPIQDTDAFATCP